MPLWGKTNDARSCSRYLAGNARHTHRSSPDVDGNGKSLIKQKHYDEARESSIRNGLIASMQRVLCCRLVQLYHFISARSQGMSGPRRGCTNSMKVAIVCTVLLSIALTLLTVFYCLLSGGQLGPCPADWNRRGRRCFKVMCRIFSS